MVHIAYVSHCFVPPYHTSWPWCTCRWTPSVACPPPWSEPACPRVPSRPRCGNWEPWSNNYTQCQGQSSKTKRGVYNQWVLCRFDVVYLHNLVGPCSPWVWVLECWNFFPDLLTYVSTWGLQRFLIWGLFILRPEAAWECLRNCDLQTKYKL